jgi:hypothetical protein
MFKRVNYDSVRGRRCIALAIAVLLVLAQSLSAAHVHQKDLRDSFTPSVVQVTDAFCALCLFYFHSPTDPGVPTAAPAPAVVERYVTPPARVRLFVTLFLRLFSRAPPASF